MADDGAANAHQAFRVIQVLTLIPAWALLAAIMAWYNEANQETPGSIITLFVGCLLGSIWAFCILLVVQRARNTALWIVFWDIVAMAVLIAGVATTSDIANTECNASQAAQQVVIIDGERISTNQLDSVDINGAEPDGPWVNPDNCNLIKAAWGLAIANIVMFFITAILAGVIYRQNKEEDEQTAVIVEEPAVIGGPPPVMREKVYTEEYDDYPRRPHRSRRHHRERSRDYDRDIEREYRRERRTSRSSRSEGRGVRSSRSVPAGRDDYV